MSPRPAKWMNSEAHDLAANAVLRDYAGKTGWTPSLPVPVEQIIECCYELRIDWRELPEEPGEQILGALFWERKVIVLNETHLNTVFRWRGPIEHTLAHELGHWLYDVNELDSRTDTLFAVGEQQSFCRGETGLTGDAKRRERNADQFAARLLMPADLVLAPLRAGAEHLPDEALAERWHVSRHSLRIRLEELGISRDPRQGALRLT